MGRRETDAGVSSLVAARGEVPRDGRQLDEIKRAFSPALRREIKEKESQLRPLEFSVRLNFVRKKGTESRAFVRSYCRVNCPSQFAVI